MGRANGLPPDLLTGHARTDALLTRTRALGAGPVPAPGAELAGLLAGGRHRRRHLRIVGGTAAFLLVSATGTGLAAAADLLPRPVQSVVSQISGGRLPAPEHRRLPSLLGTPSHTLHQVPPPGAQPTDGPPTPRGTLSGHSPVGALEGSARPDHHGGSDAASGTSGPGRPSGSAGGEGGGAGNGTPTSGGGGSATGPADGGGSNPGVGAGSGTGSGSADKSASDGGDGDATSANAQGGSGGSVDDGANGSGGDSTGATSPVPAPGDESGSTSSGN